MCLYGISQSEPGFSTTEHLIELMRKFITRFAGRWNLILID